MKAKPTTLARRRQILARIRANKRVAQAAIQLPLALALGSAQLQHIISQPIHRHPHLNNGAHQVPLLAGGHGSRHLCLQLLRALAAQAPAGRTWQAAWEAIDNQLQALAAQAQEHHQLARIERQRAILATILDTGQATIRAIEQISQARAFLQQETAHFDQKRIRGRRRVKK